MCYRYLVLFVCYFRVFDSDAASLFVFFLFEVEHDLTINITIIHSPKTNSN